MARHFKIDDVLSAGDRPAYAALMREPGTTIDMAMEWLAEHGYKVSRGAVHNHRKDFEETLKSVRRSAELASSFNQVAKEGGVAGLSDAALARLSQVVMEASMSLDAEEGVDPEVLESITRSVGNVVRAKQTVEKLREEYEAKQRAALDEAAAKAQTGGSAVDVIGVMKKALGMAA